MLYITNLVKVYACVMAVKIYVCIDPYVYMHIALQYTEEILHILYGKKFLGDNVFVFRGSLMTTKLNFHELNQPL